MTYWVYILENELSRKYYIGQTSDLDERIKRHNSGRSKYTSGGKWKIIYTEQFDSHRDAIWCRLTINSHRSR
ncbi:GIY-YIG nuclease family protein [bacterium]|nr:GIY-YIG nuclease family protein [bacterium]